MKTRVGLAALGLFSSISVPAQNHDIPVSNWTVPPYVRPASASLTTMAGIGPLVFVAIPPCRVLDTRQAGQGPPLNANSVRTVSLDSTCMTPGGVQAYSLSFGVILPPADGFLTAWPHGGPQPTISQVNFLAGEVIANAAILPGGSIDVVVNVGPTHIYLDMNGYFAAENAGSLLLSGTENGPILRARNDGGSAETTGVEGRVTHPQSNPVSAGVLGVNLGNGQGVRGFSAKGYGVQGISATTFNSAGIQGEIVFPAAPIAGFARAGVRGMDTSGFGVLGVSESDAVTGHLVSSGLILASGSLGTSFGTDPDGGGPPWGVHAVGNIGATGTKAFLEPHPTDPTKVIQYIALEGPEAGTYFRGRGRFQRGLARIPVPEDFRMVTDAEGLTVQITPIGGMASFGVVRMDLNEIVVQGSRDLEFSYLVQGFRASFKGEPTILRDGTFLPRSPEDRMPAGLAERQKRLLVSNGTYNEDGTVNMETARRRGWTETWERRGAERPAAGSEAP